MRAGTAPNAMEARRQRSMSYMLFIMTLMVLLDRRTHRDRMLAVHRQRTGPAHGTNHHEVPAADAPKTAIGGLLAGLDSTLSRCQRAPLPFAARLRVTSPNQVKRAKLGSKREVTTFSQSQASISRPSRRFESQLRLAPLFGVGPGRKINRSFQLRSASLPPSPRRSSSRCCAVRWRHIWLCSQLLCRNHVSIPFSL